MTSKPPEYVLKCIKQAGVSFYEHLNALNWPDANRDAPAKEANVVLHLAHQLMQERPDFHVYLEAATRGSGRLDLLAANKEVALAMEAKCFGNIGEKAEELSSDVNRLKEFSPRYAKLKLDVAAEDWWVRAPSRWGIALAASFRGDNMAEAWMKRDSSLLQAKDQAGFDMLNESLEDAYRDRFFINDGGRWKSCGQVYLLVAAFEIKNEP